MFSDSSRAFFRLELAEALRSRWLLFTCAVYGVVFAGFLWLGASESTVLGFTGLSRVALNLSNAIVMVVPLVVLVATCQSIVRARSSGFFELMLSQPCRRSEWLTGLVGSRLVVLVGPLVLLLAGMTLVGVLRGEGTAILSIAGRTLLVGVTLAWAFLGMGLLVSSVARTGERATVLALLVWAVTSALHDFALIALLLKVRLPASTVFTLAAANPVEAARIAILAGVDPDLSVLGPVGFWLANTLGPIWSLAIGAVWPLALGTGATWMARRRLETADLVG
jgi:ABC-2 type transport system permease protein